MSLLLVEAEDSSKLCKQQQSITVYIPHLKWSVGWHSLRVFEAS